MENVFKQHTLIKNNMRKKSNDPKPVSPNVSRVIVYDPNNKRTMDLDPVNGGILPTVELDQSMVNRGNSFTASSEIKFNNVMPKYFLLRTPNNNIRTFLSGEINTTKPILVNLYEGITTSSVGILIATFNDDRNSNMIPETKAYQNPIFTDKGDKILPKYVKEKGFPMKRRILKHNTDYLIEITPSKKNTTVFINLNWFETKNAS